MGCLGGYCVGVSLLIRAGMHRILMAVYHLDNMAKYGVSNYNPVFGELFTVEGSLGMLLKKMYLRYFVNGVAYLPITFLVLSWVIIGALAVFYTIKKKNPWVILCVPAMISVPVLSSIAAGRAEAYHSAQFVPIVIMLGYLFFGAALHPFKGPRKRIVSGATAALALGGIAVQIKDMNKWFIQDYDKYLEAKQIMAETAEKLLENYDVSKPVVVVGAALPRRRIMQRGLYPTGFLEISDDSKADLF